MGRVKPGRTRRDRPSAAEALETHEPPLPLPGWPGSHAVSELTGDDQEECVVVTIHGVKHYLHATTARELHRDLEGTLTEYNSLCRAHGMPQV